MFFTFLIISVELAFAAYVRSLGKGDEMCKHARILKVSAKCSDLCQVQYGLLEHVGYVPTNLGITDDSDYISFDLCMNCGVITSGKFPVSDATIRRDFQK